MASNFSSSPKDCFATGKLRNASAGALYLCLCVCDVSRGGKRREKCGNQVRSVQCEHLRTQHQCRHQQNETRRKEKCRRSKARGWDHLVSARLVNGHKPSTNPVGEADGRDRGRSDETASLLPERNCCYCRLKWVAEAGERRA